VPDPIAPPVASRPAEAVELVSLAVSDGDLDAALAQYEAGAVLRPWARDPGGDKDGVADALIQLMGLRLRCLSGSARSYRATALPWLPVSGTSLAPARTASRYS
jgi:hypothetical protein